MSASLSKPSILVTSIDLDASLCVPDILPRTSSQMSQPFSLSLWTYPARSSCVGDLPIWVMYESKDWNGHKTGWSCHLVTPNLPIPFCPQAHLGHVLSEARGLSFLFNGEL